MKHKSLLRTVLLAVLMIHGTAFAENSLLAVCKEGQIVVEWDAPSANQLTLYRNGWPVCVLGVESASGKAVLTCPNQEGKYSVRLTTDEGCVQTDVNVCDSEAMAEPMPTVKPMETSIATAKPTQAPVQSDSASSSLAAQVIQQVNEERAKYGLSALKEDVQLTEAACVRAREIAELFSHTRPDGSSWSTVSSKAAGENIAKGHGSVDRVMAAWMSSEGHRENILREGFGSIGVCALEIDGVLYWVQLFGR